MLRKLGVTAALTGLCLGVTSGPAAAHLPSVVRAYVAQAVETPPIIDGRLDDPCWQTAEVAGDFVVRGGDWGDLAEVQTRIRLCYDDQALYLAAECDEPLAPALRREPRHRDADVYEDGCVSLLIAVGDPAAGPDYEIAVDSAGTQYDFRRDMGELWDGDWTAAASIGESGWTLEMRLPFSDFGQTAAAGDIWVMQVLRWRVVEGESVVSLWSPVPTGWHTKLWVPPTFGHLLFGHQDRFAADYVERVAAALLQARPRSEENLRQVASAADLARFDGLYERLGQVRERAHAQGLSGDQWAGVLREVDELERQLSDFVWPLLTAAALGYAPAESAPIAQSIRADSARESLVYEDFMTLDMEEDHQVSTAFETPHVKWAQPLPGGPVKVLFVLQMGPGDAGVNPGTPAREAVELKQRFDLEAAVAFVTGERVYGGKAGHQRLARLLEQDHDVIVLCNASLKALSAREQYQVLAKAAQGTGLVLVGAQPQWLTDSVQPDAAPAVEVALDANPPPDSASRIIRHATTFSLGAGRVALITYDGVPLHALTPRLPYSRANLTAYDYHIGFVGRAVLWAAGRPPAATLDVRALSGRRLARETLPREITLATATGPLAGARLEAWARRLETGARERVEGVRMLSAEGASLVRGRLPLLPAGRYVFEITAHAPRGMLGFASAEVEVTSQTPAPRIALDRDFAEVGETISGTVALEDGVRPGDELLLRVRDSYDRIVAQWRHPARAATPFSWRASEAATARMDLEAGLWRADAEVVSSRAPLWVPQRHRGRWAQVMWNAPPDALGYWAMQRLSEAGFNVCLQGGAPPPLTEAFNWAFVPYTTRILDQFDEAGVMQPACWNDEPAISAHVAAIADRQAAARKHGVYAYSLGDETTTRGACTAAPCLHAYREWLAGEYEGSIAALNAAWEADYQSFDEIDLIGYGKYTGARLAYEEAALDAGLYARWADRQRFAQYNFLRLCERFHRAFSELDPQAVTGFEGAGGMGDDVLAIARALGFWAPYGGPGDEVLRSVKSRDMITSNWLGYARDAYPLIADAWRLVFNDCNAFFWWRWDNLGLFHGYVAPDLDLWPATVDLTREMQVVRDGLGDYLIGAERLHDGVAVLYSVPSALATQTPPGAALGDYERANVSATLATMDAGLTYKYVTDEQVAAGALGRGEYRALWLPCALALSDQAAAAIVEFARGGGLVIADVEPGTWNERLAAAPRPHLAGLFQPGGGGVLLGQDFQAYRELREEEQGARLRERLRTIFQGAGIEPAVRVTNIAGPQWGIVLARWRRGETEVVGLLQRQARVWGGAPVPSPATVRLTLPGLTQISNLRHVYDVRAREYLGERPELEVTLSPGRGAFFALLPETPGRVILSAEPAVVAAGETARVTLSVEGARGPRAVRLTAESPAGGRTPWIDRTIMVDGGEATFTLQTAFNDQPGAWKITARDLFGGEAAARLTVR